MEKKLKVDLYLIETLTNMRVGSGDTNFGVIDNQIQRDTITNLPIIHSSSLKGAIREFFEDKDKNGFINFISGGEEQMEDNKKQSQEGCIKFFEANILTRPVRSSARAYTNATSIEVLKEFFGKIKIFNIELNDESIKGYESFLNIGIQDNNPVSYESCFLEDFQTQINQTLKDDLKKTNLAIFSNKDFKELDYPVIARNKLDENGISENLWYEEIVPKKTLFYFFIAKPTNLAKDSQCDEKLSKYIETFDKALMENIVQFGANKSIGYGFTKITKVSNE